jgi:hypothetical protein
VFKATISHLWASPSRKEVFRISPEKLGIDSLLNGEPKIKVSKAIYLEAKAQRCLA